MYYLDVLHLFEMGAVQLNQMRAIPLLEMGQLFEMGAVQLFEVVAVYPRVVLRDWILDNCLT